METEKKENIIRKKTKRRRKGNREKLKQKLKQKEKKKIKEKKNKKRKKQKKTSIQTASVSHYFGQSPRGRDAASFFFVCLFLGVVVGRACFSEILKS